ncbi:uncharacterized protein LOC131161605 [Malania oleifera]|uniref:uncharacterized protein LOC131161605 n=1 Tax=Malania oleifera TaxID=397392 RepID=UPI0025ADAE1A|nr:uncharacterized protein LOC131161605 [Malania oleifera]
MGVLLRPPPSRTPLSISSNLMALAAAATTTACTSKLPSAVLFSSSSPHRLKSPLIPRALAASTRHSHATSLSISVGKFKCKSTEISEVESSSASIDSGGSDDGMNWVPVVPLAALPKGERRVLVQDGEAILLLWYKDEVFAIENRSPAEGAYTEGLLNAKLTQDGSIVCPTTDSTFDLRTGAIKDWYPKNPVLRALTPALRTLFVYPVKTDDENIYISIRSGLKSDAAAEIVFSGKAQPGVTATDVNVEEVRMVIDEDVGGFGFTGKNELINGKAAVIGFLLLLDFELLTGKGLLKGTGFLDFLYNAADAFK